MTAPMPNPELGKRVLRGVSTTAATVDMTASIHMSFSARLDDGTFIDALKLRRNYGSSGEAPAQTPEVRLKGCWTYFGYLPGHFGDFLLEGLSRCWHLAEARPHQAICHAKPRRFSGWQREILGILGFNWQQISIVDRPVWIEELVVPDPGVIRSKFIHPRLLDALAVRSFQRPRRGKKIWLSRTQVPLANGQVIGEHYLEAALSKHGWTIYHPELHSVTSQLETLSDAEVIAGIEGSAFHLLMLAKDIRARVRIIPRGNELFDAFTMIADAKAIDQAALVLDMHHVDGKHRRANFRLRDPDASIAKIIDL